MSRDEVAPRPRGRSALQEAEATGAEAARRGFDWPGVEGPLAKVDEELAELREVVARGDRDRVEAELGDALFALVNVARHVGVDPERALAGTCARFARRFSHLEAALTARGVRVEQATPEELDLLWRDAKRAVG